jgi:hypothetical protein
MNAFPIEREGCMGKCRRHSGEFKRRAVEKMKTSDNIHELARELEVRAAIQELPCRIIAATVPAHGSGVAASGTAGEPQGCGPADEERHFTGHAAPALCPHHRFEARSGKCT